jgi:hypothetical protein
VSLRLERTAFETFRAAEYFDARQLSTLTGVPMSDRSLMPSLALIFQVIEYVDGTGEGDAVGLKRALQAAAWCEYLETRARRLYSSAENSAMEGARALLERIRKGDVSDGDSSRSIYRKHRAKLSTPDEVNSACSVLEEFGWLRIEAVKTSGRSTTKRRLHPALREQS